MAATRPSLGRASRAESRVQTPREPSATTQHRPCRPQSPRHNPNSRRRSRLTGGRLVDRAVDGKSRTSSTSLARWTIRIADLVDGPLLAVQSRLNRPNQVEPGLANNKHMAITSHAVDTRSPI